MNFLFDSVCHYDYLTASVVQGLNVLGHNCYGRYDNGNNYLEPHQEQPYSVFVSARDSRVSDIPPSIPLVVLWGADSGTDNRPIQYPFYGGRFDAAFVRDYRGGGPTNVFPINFGIEDRYYCATNKARNPLRKRKWDIAFLGNIDTTDRQMIVAFLQEKFKNFNLLIGPRQFNENEPPWNRWLNTHAGHDSKYFKALAESKVVLSLMGHGPDTARTWEALASGGVLVMQELPSIMCPPPLVDEKHCFRFRNLQKLYSVCMDILEDPIRYQDVADRGFHSGRYFHTTKHRARYFLETLKMLKLIDLPIDNN